MLEQTAAYIFIGTTLMYLPLYPQMFSYPELNHNHFFLSRSESPSQVFVIVVEWLYEVLQHLPEDKWEQLVIAYDNMCHLNSLRAAQSPLPLPPPYDQMWIRVTKVYLIFPEKFILSFKKFSLTIGDWFFSFQKPQRSQVQRAVQPTSHPRETSSL